MMHFSREFSPGKPKTRGDTSTEQVVSSGKDTDSVATGLRPSCPWTRILDDGDDFNSESLRNSVQGRDDLGAIFTPSEAAMEDSCLVHQAHSQHLSMQSPEAQASACSS